MRQLISNKPWLVEDEIFVNLPWQHPLRSSLIKHESIKRVLKAMRFGTTEETEEGPLVLRDLLAQ